MDSYQNGDHPAKSNDVIDTSFNEYITVRSSEKQKPRQKHRVALEIIDNYNGWWKKDSSFTGQKLLNKLIQHRKQILIKRHFLS